MLIIFGGLPGSGKSAVAQALALRTGACYLRVDTIEQAISSSTPLADRHDVGPAGYVTLYRVTEDNLRLGNQGRAHQAQVDLMRSLWMSGCQQCAKSGHLMQSHFLLHHYRHLSSKGAVRNPATAI
ncbi:AAA family ATPase [Agrobacterium tumefaciens]|uniref:AAA family ATPase n=1 Tax=Agrobacterium tumefaciens TaxID=358 RepID=UPI00389931CE